MCVCVYVFHFICMRAGHGFARVFLFIMMASPSSRDYRTESPSSPTVSNNEGELQRLEARAGLQIWTWPIYYRLKLSERREREGVYVQFNSIASHFHLILQNSDRLDVHLSTLGQGDRYVCIWRICIHSFLDTLHIFVLTILNLRESRTNFLTCACTYRIKQ